MTTKLEALMDYCVADDRICPMHCPWDDFWKLLKNSAREQISQHPFSEADDPPAPRILSSWSFSDDSQKRETLLAQIRWAEAHGVLPEADHFLRALPLDDWKCETVLTGGWTREDWDWSRRDIRERDRNRQELDAIHRKAHRLEAEQHRLRKPSVDECYYASLDNDLVAAYRATNYVVFGNPPIDLKIGEYSSQLADLFAKVNVTCAAYITGWNPRGKVSSDNSNRVAHERLVTVVESEGLAWLPGEGRGTIGDWDPEASILDLGCKRQVAKKIGHLFRQNAIVWIGENAVPELVFLMPIQLETTREGEEV